MGQSGGDKSGHGGSGGMSGGVVHMGATYSNDGNHVDVQVGGNHYGGNGLAAQMSQYGAVIYSSQWVGWVPGNCGGDGNLQASSFAVSDVKITGRVVQGPEPTRCSGPPTPAPTQAPPSPSPPSPPSPPLPGCPGGTLAACIHLCPGNPPTAFSACIKDCERRCGNDVIV